MPPLKNDKHEKFAQGIVKYAGRKGGRERALKEAGFECKTLEEGSTSASARVTQLLKHVKISQRVSELHEQAASRIVLTKSRVLREVARIAFFDIRRCYDAFGNLLPISDLDPDTAAAIQGIEKDELFADSANGQVKVGYTKKIKVADKNSALDKLMKFYGLYKTDDGEIKNQAGQTVHFHYYLPDNGRDKPEAKLQEQAGLTVINPSEGQASQNGSVVPQLPSNGRD